MAIREIENNGIKYSISYEILNADKQKCILFLHGWGSNKQVMRQAFGEYLGDFKHIYVDLAGFGDSSIDKPLNTKEYKDLVQNFLNNLGVHVECVVGHSFGGKVATLLNPKNLVLLSSAGILTKKPFKIKAKIKIFKVLKVLGFGGLYKLFATKDVENMSKTMYETLKKVVDENFSEIFANYEGKSYIFWGEDDNATPLSSGEKIAELIKNSEFFPLRGDHFFFLQHAKFIDGILRDELC